MKVLRITDLLLGATVLAPLFAPLQSVNAQPVGIENECDRLITMLQQSTTANGAVTIEQARTYKEDSNIDACRTALDKMQDSKDNDAKTVAKSVDNNAASTASAGSTSGANSNIVVQQGAPTISVESPSPQVTVQQQAPTVSVTQGQPEITVHQPAPVVTIDIPKPEITVRMPKPSVEVAQAAPEVVVNQPKPEVHVIPPAKPDVNTTTAQTNVAVSQAAPIIHYESEQPQVHVTQAQGEPTIKVEQFDRTIDRAAPTTASLPGTGPQVTASELTGKTVMGPQGQKLGTVKAVILDAQNRPFIVVERSGIGSTIGILAKQIPIPAQNAKLDGGQVMIQGLTMAQINGIREYKSEPTYRTVQGDQTISMIRS